MQQRWYSVSEAARELGVGGNYINTLLARGQLEGKKVQTGPRSQEWRIPSKAIKTLKKRLALYRQARELKGA